MCQEWESSIQYWSTDRCSSILVKLLLSSRTPHARVSSSLEDTQPSPSIQVNRVGNIEGKTSLVWKTPVKVKMSTHALMHFDILNFSYSCSRSNVLWLITKRISYESEWREQLFSYRLYWFPGYYAIHATDRPCARATNLSTTSSNRWSFDHLIIVR